MCYPTGDDDYEDPWGDDDWDDDDWGTIFRKLQCNSLEPSQNIVPDPIFNQFLLVCGIVNLCYEGSEI